jgi:pyridoxamine 5'-phosphate oxidase
MLRAMEEHDLDPNPLVQFQNWLAEAQASSPRADAMTLATATANGLPSARTVLLQRVDERGFVFFTNRESRKGSELAENPHASLVFHWYELGRQVRIEGAIEPVASAESEAYWRTRPRGSQLAAWASPQSQVIADRAHLDRLYAEAEAAHAEGEVPVPPFWGGYRLLPRTLEFWVHRESRLHDRTRYTRSESGWRRERLAP